MTFNEISNTMKNDILNEISKNEEKQVHIEIRKK